MRDQRGDVAAHGVRAQRITPGFEGPDLGRADDAQRIDGIQPAGAGGQQGDQQQHDRARHRTAVADESGGERRGARGCAGDGQGGKRRGCGHIRQP
ncbi:hypothetical protein G6F59_017448 [Rhizopus arrhizus]|nr:hypothetical protein G6F59_017448 [Rhizopus arrhizus]